MEKIKRALVYFFVLILVFNLIPQFTNAAALTSISDTLTRLKVSELSSHDILFNLDSGNTFATGETITVDFGEDDSKFTVAGASSAIADFDFNDGTERTVVAVNTGAPSCAAGANNVAIGINDTTGVVTIEACSGYTASGSGATVNIEYGTSAGGTNRVTNPSSAATYVLDIGGTNGDSGKFAIAILTDDQIPVSAAVDPTLTFTVVNTTLALGTLSSSSISTSSYNNITVGTNGSGGYTISVRDDGNSSNPGLYNSPASKLIASADATPLSVGSEGYGGQCNKVSGSGSCTFTGSGDNVDGFLLAYQTFASHGSKPTGTDTFQVRVKATISTSTDAGSYADTLTLVAAANF